MDRRSKSSLQYPYGSCACSYTIQRHFEHKYNRPVRLPRIVGIRMGATAIIPAEFCQIVPGQVYRKKLPPETQKDFLGFSTQKPAERLRDIQNAVSGQAGLRTPSTHYPTDLFS